MIFKKKPLEQKRRLVKIFVFDTNKLLNELKLIKKLSRYLKKKKWDGQIVIPWVIHGELKGMHNGISAKKKNGHSLIRNDERNEKRLLKQSKKALALIEKERKNSVWSIDDSGEEIIPSLLEKEELSQTQNPKRPSMNDLSALATAISLKRYYRRIDFKENRVTRVYLVTADRRLKAMTCREGLMVLMGEREFKKIEHNQDNQELLKSAMRRYGIVPLDTLKKLWAFNRTQKKIKRKIFEIRKKYLKYFRKGD